MYHKNNFGRFSYHVERFADLDGYVPEDGDAPHDLTWDALADWTPEAWEEFVFEAEMATTRAVRDQYEWEKAENQS
jgi:hypothetical protein